MAILNIYSAPVHSGKMKVNMTIAVKFRLCLCLTAALAGLHASSAQAGTNLPDGALTAKPGVLSVADAHSVIERAYRDILHRPPDRTGLQSFTEQLLKENRDEKWLRDALQNSPEGRKLSGVARKRVILVTIPAFCVTAFLLVLFLRRRNIKDFIFKLAMLIISIAFACLLLEVMLRVRAGATSAGNTRAMQNMQNVTTPAPGTKVTLQKMIRVSRNPDIIYELIADMSVKFMGGIVTTGSDGFRITPGSSNATNSLCIIGLGDSVMFGWGVNDEETYFSGICRQLNTEQPGQPVKGINMSVPGYNTVMEVETLRAKGLRYNPGLVMIHFVENDLWLPNFICTETPASELTSSHLLSAISRGLGGGLRTEPFASLVDSNDSVPAKYRNMVGEKAYLAAMKELGVLSRQHGFKVVIITNWDAPPFLWEAAKESGFPIIELGPTIEAYCRNRAIKEYQGSVLTVSKRDPHYSALAHELACRTILAFLKEHQLLVRPAAINIQPAHTNP